MTPAFKGKALNHQIPAALQPLTVAIAEQRWQDLAQIAETILANQPESLMYRHAANIGVLLREAQQFELAAHYFERALAGLQDARYLQVMASLASTLSRVPRYADSAKWGVQSMQIRDEQAMRGRFQQRVIAFSLFGNNPAYCEPLVINAQLMPSLFPEWTMRVYHDDSVAQSLLQRLRALSVECINVVTIGAQHYPGTFWRFLALEDENLDAVIMRDADSLLNERDQVLVNAWLASDKPFHIMRDWYTQTNLILAGMWGARYGLLAAVRTWIERFIQAGNLHPTHADQHFLEQYIWPRVKPYMLHHSSVLDCFGAQWEASLARHNEVEGNMQPLGSWQLTKYTPNTNQPYTVTLYDEHNQQVCRYDFPAGEPYELPNQYRDAINSGHWRMEVIEHRSVSVSLPGGGKSTATIMFNRKK